jgi:hypothetical protein
LLTFVLKHRLDQSGVNFAQRFSIKLCLQGKGFPWKWLFFQVSLWCSPMNFPVNPVTYYPRANQPSCRGLGLRGPYYVQGVWSIFTTSASCSVIFYFELSPRRNEASHV